MIKFLLDEAKADLQARDDEGENVLEIAKKYGKKGLPKDFTLIKKKNGSVYKIRQIEVKTTRGKTGYEANFSGNEFAEMLRYKQANETYSIYRLFNAGKKNASSVIKNPLEKILDGSLELSFIGLKI